MKSLLSIPLAFDVEILTVKGQKLKAGDPLAKKKSKSHKEKIALSSILSVKPATITTFLVKKIGAPIKKGEVIAKKEGLFKNIRVLSPLTGIIESVDLKDGCILITTQNISDIYEYSPVSGIVEGVNNEEITLSFEGKVIEGIEGKGRQVVGFLASFAQAVDMFHFTGEVANKIVAAVSFTDGALAKLGALGARGIISCQYYPGFPNVKLSEKQLKEVFNHNLKQIILLGDKRRIVIPVNI